MALALRIPLVFLRRSSSWKFRSPLFICPLFGGFHCFGHSSGRGSGCCLPVWVWRIVFLWSSNPCSLSAAPSPQILCCSTSVSVASKINRSLVRGTRTNSTCTRSGRCNVSPRLLLLDAYYCQSIARNSVPSFRDQQRFVHSCSPSRSRPGRAPGFSILDRLAPLRPRFEAPAAERTQSVPPAEAERLVTTTTPGGRLRPALQGCGAAARALPGWRPAPPPLRFSGPMGPARRYAVARRCAVAATPALRRRAVVRL